MEENATDIRVDNNAITMFENYPDVVSVEQVAEMLHLSDSFVYRLLRAGKIKAKRIGKRYIIAKISIINFIKTEE